ncbi:MAG: SIMPL domain-containing protein [Candidatus Nanopelagicaceae bacterium]
MKKIISSLTALVLALGFVAYNALPASAAENSKHITVTGVGTSSITPDAVRFFASVSALAKSNKEALASASKSASAVRGALRDNGIAAKDIKTSSLTVYPEYNYTQDRGQELLGYRATQSFTVVIRKADNAGVVIDAAVTAGGDAVQLNGISPFLLNGAAATEKAREAAVADARARASSYAKYLGASLGRVIWLTEVSAPVYNFPIMAKGAVAEDATQIDLGETEVTVTVNVRWGIN